MCTEVAYEARTDSGLGDLDGGNEGVLVKVGGGVSEVIVRRLAIKGVDVRRETDSVRTSRTPRCVSVGCAGAGSAAGTYPTKRNHFE